MGMDDEISENPEYGSVPQNESVRDENSHQEEETPSEDNRISMEHAIELLGFGRFQWTILLATGLCFAADAMQITLLSFLSPILKRNWELSDNETSLVTSVLFAGAMAGTLILGPLADREGRRPVFLLAATIISCAGLGVAVSSSYNAILVMIFSVGFGVGGLTVPFDILAEFLPSDGRGTNLLKIEYFWTIGCLYVVIIAQATLSHNAWRMFVGICTIPSILSFLIGYIFVPESPRWLASQGKVDEAMEILRRAARVNGHDVEFIFPTSVTLIPEPQVDHASITELFKPRWRNITIRLWGGWCTSAFGYYGTLLAITRVFESNTKTGEEAFDYGAIFVSSAAELVGVTLVIVAVDRVGRIPSQVAAYSCAGLSVFGLCLFHKLGFLRLTLVSLGFGARVFEMAGTCVTWVSTAEILTTEVRGTGHSTANAMGRIGAFFCPFLVEGSYPLIMVGVTMLCIHFATAVFVSKLPETKGMSMGLAEHQSDVGGEDENDLSMIETGYDDFGELS